MPVTDRCCGADCIYAYLDEEGAPYDGELHVVDEELIYEGEEIVDSYWVHVCDAHRARYQT